MASSLSSPKYFRSDYTILPLSRRFEEPIVRVIVALDLKWVTQTVNGWTWDGKLIAIGWDEADTLVGMTDSDTIARFLRDNLGMYYCDDCLSEETTLKSPNHVNRIKRRLLTMPRDFDEGKTCDSCSRRRKSIAFLPRLESSLGPQRDRSTERFSR